MGIHDFMEIFDQLDSSHKGFLTLDQITEFHSSLCQRQVRENFIQLSIEKVCGPHKYQVPREQFYDVVVEVNMIWKTYAILCY